MDAAREGVALVVEDPAGAGPGDADGRPELERAGDTGQLRQPSPLGRVGTGHEGGAALGGHLEPEVAIGGGAGDVDRREAGVDRLLVMVRHHHDDQFTPVAVEVVAQGRQPVVGRPVRVEGGRAVGPVLRGRGVRETEEGDGQVGGIVEPVGDSRHHGIVGGDGVVGGDRTATLARRRARIAVELAERVSTNTEDTRQSGVAQHDLGPAPGGDARGEQ
jgi:hypothetical protein